MHFYNEWYTKLSYYVYLISYIIKIIRKLYNYLNHELYFKNNISYSYNKITSNIEKKQRKFYILNKKTQNHDLGIKEVVDWVTYWEFLICFLKLYIILSMSGFSLHVVPSPINGVLHLHYRDF